MSDGLLPATAPARKERVDRELPQEARSWGRILDLTHLEAGDLLLFRNVPPHIDRVAKAIVSAQSKGGLHERHAQWTHAAVYLGDGEHVCEANFGLAGFPRGVIMRSAHCYCDGTYAIRARRPRNMDERQRLRIALGAMSNLGKGYSLGQIFSFWSAARTGRGFWSSTPRGLGSKLEPLSARRCTKTPSICLSGNDSKDGFPLYAGAPKRQHGFRTVGSPVELARN